MPPLKITLPSGQIATLRKPAAERPWRAVREGSVYVLRRIRRGDSSQWETFANQGSITPLCLDLTDAEALMTALNAKWPRAAEAVMVEETSQGNKRRPGA